MSDLVDN